MNLTKALLFFVADKTPLFSPSWEYKQTFANVELPSLGLIISIVENNIEKCRQSVDDHKIIEYSVYLLWHHLQLYITVSEVREQQKEQIQRLLYESNRVISDMFFSKIQSTIMVSYKLFFVFLKSTNYYCY